MKAKIFVAYHREATLLKNEILEPIHVGRELHTSDWLENNMIGDNIGKNISSKNNRYCELTAQYYIWKNQDILKDTDYLGFCHYRRFLNFNTNVKYDENILSVVEYPYINEHCYERFGLNKDNIYNVLDGYDVITAKPTDLTKIKRKSVYQQYKTAHNIKDYHTTIEILLKKYPEFQKAVEIYNHSEFGYFTNTFIMKKELFIKYAEWLFSILFEAENYIEEYDDFMQNRVMGYLGERLFGIYITYLKQQKYKIKELQQVLVLSTEIKKYIPIVFSCNNNYALHLCCAITSILENANKEDFFFIYIINTKKNLNYINKKLLAKLQRKNCNISFLTIDNNRFVEMPITGCCKHISIETYYRYILPELLPMYNKILYLDCDITVQKSLNEIYNQDIEEYYIGGVEDILLKENSQRLNLTKYCNAGVLLVNLKKWREENIQNKLIEYTHNNIEKIVWQDQDVINIVLQDGIKYFDKIWNTQVGDYKHSPNKSNSTAKKAAIIHHIGVNKPWLLGSKSTYKSLYFTYLNKMGWEYKFVKYYILKIHLSCIFIHTFLKNLRKSLIWYDRTNSQLILLSTKKIPFSKIRHKQ